MDFICIFVDEIRKTDSECRIVKEQWGYQYFIIASGNKAACIICNEKISVLTYNIKRHYEIKHSHIYSKFTHSLRLEKYECLKRGLKSQQLLFNKVNAE